MPFKRAVYQIIFMFFKNPEEMFGYFYKKLFQPESYNLTEGIVSFPNIFLAHFHL